VPLVYSVSFLGKLSVLPPVPADADADPDAAGVLDDGLLLQALATPSVCTATAAVPYRHRLPVPLLVGLTCSCLLTSKSCDNPAAD
jgi:hypothetical protein